MNEPQLFREVEDRTFFAHHMLLHAAEIEIADAEASEVGRFNKCLAAMVLTALAVEGLVNAVGSRVAADYPAFERLRPLEKLELLARALEPNRTVDSDTLRQGAARRRWKSCPVRPLAAKCRSPLRQASMRAALAFAWIAALSPAVAAMPCIAPGEPIHWRADYCMLKMETDDEIAISECLEKEGKRRFPNACASNTHFKSRMCALMIRRGTKAGTMEQCVKDPSFKGRTVQGGGVGA